MSAHSIHFVILSREDGEESLTFSARLGDRKWSEMFRSAQHDSLEARSPISKRRHQ